MALPTPGVTPANWGAQLNAEITAAQAAAVLVLPKPGMYVAAPFAPGTAVLGLNEACAVPLVLSYRGASFDQVAARVTTAGTAGAVVRLGVYADSTTTPGYPGALIADWGTIDATTVGAKTIAISWTPTAGVYWLVGCAQGAISTCYTNNGSGAMGLSTANINNTFLSVVTGYTETVSGALPANWTTTLSEKFTTARVGLRAA